MHIGARVLSPNFGEGVITGLYAEKVDVNFDAHGPKTLWKKWSNLTVLGAGRPPVPGFTPTPDPEPAAPAAVARVSSPAPDAPGTNAGEDTRATEAPSPAKENGRAPAKEKAAPAVKEKKVADQSNRGKLDVAEMKRLYESGLSLAEIGKRMGCAMQAVHYRLKKAGVERRPANGTLQTGNSKLAHNKNVSTAEMIRLYEGGMTCQEIGDQLGMSRPGVAYRLQQAGVILRRGGTRPDHRRGDRPSVVTALATTAKRIPPTARVGTARVGETRVGTARVGTPALQVEPATIFVAMAQEIARLRGEIAERQNRVAAVERAIVALEGVY